jgi:hypothetical protein
MAHVAGGELAPVLVEFDTLAQGDSPGLAIWRHLPLFSQLGNIRSGITVNADEKFQGRTLIKKATDGMQPGPVGVDTPVVPPRL